MKLIDTNLVIYTAQPNYRWLLPQITTTIIAATALVHNLELHTHNIEDFKGIYRFGSF